jgi:hypothetical protein
MQYNPFDWYWLAKDGRLYSSSREGIVSPTDTAYEAWLAGSDGPTAWPVDTTGNQTSAALQQVLAPYNLFADLAHYAANSRFNAEVGGYTVMGFNFPTDRDTQAKLTAAAVMAQVVPTATFSWKLADGTFTGSLSASQMIQIAAAIGGHVNALFGAEDTIDKAIVSGTISTRAQVDAAIAAVI